MSADSVVAPVIKTIIVECAPREAFRYFTADLAKWWPLATHSCVAFASDHKDQPVSCSFEQFEGGRIVERGSAGEEHVWGTVLTWEPPSRVVFTWHPMQDESFAQTVEVTFNPVANGTEVILTHAGWERSGDDAQQQRESYNQGWDGVFVVSYAGYVRDQER